MAQPKNKSSRNNKAIQKFTNYVKQCANMNFIGNLMTNPKYLPSTCLGLLLLEILLNIFIIERVRYTEIDWIAYMQEVEGFLNGTLDYKLLRGECKIEY